MKKLIFCCFIVRALMACSERNAIAGRWAMEIDGTHETSFVLSDDSICSPELTIGNDTIYMEVKSDGQVVKREFIGVYSLKGDRLKVVNRKGEEQVCVYRIEDDKMILTTLAEPDKILMRLTKIKED